MKTELFSDYFILLCNPQPLYRSVIFKEFASINGYSITVTNWVNRKLLIPTSVTVNCR